jgi:hypothetical protein
MQVGSSGMSYLTPLLAKVTIEVTTSEALTAQTYSNMLWLKQQRDQGSLTANDEKVMGVINKGASAASNWASNTFGENNILSKGISAASNYLGNKLIPLPQRKPTL